MNRVTIKKSTKNIGLHYIISVNGNPVYIANTKKEAEKRANTIKMKLRRKK